MRKDNKDTKELMKEIGKEISDMNTGMTLDKNIKIDSLLDKLDKDVANNLISKYPDGIKGMNDCAGKYADVTGKVIESNNSSNQTYYDIEKDIINAAKDQIQNADVPFEEKIEWEEKMEKCAERVNKKNSEDKVFLLKLFGMVSAIFFGIIGLVAALFLNGVGVNFSKRD